MKKQFLSLYFIAFFICGNLAKAQFNKLYDFGTNTFDGSEPVADLLYFGNYLYGMTSYGGTQNLGTIFKIKPDGTGYLKILDFAGPTKGQYPTGSLVSDGTFLYGMTPDEGPQSSGYGTIFKVKPDGSGYSKIRSFVAASNGSAPKGSLVFDGTFLYGMTWLGGANSKGTIFKIKPDGTSYTTLLDFSGTATGSDPLGTLIYDGTFLYGMTTGGGSSDFGTLFKIKTDGSAYQKLLDFTGTLNGQYPNGALISDGTFLYGMTSNGGLFGQGTAFKIKQDGTGFMKLLDFDCSTIGCSSNGSLISDGTFLYGMAVFGASNSKGNVFKIKTDGSGYLKLLDFDGVSNGQTPLGSLILVGNSLYGMTASGGANNIGVIFKQDKNNPTVDIKENMLSSGFSVFPNPFSSNLTIQSKINFDNVSLSVYNIFGQLVKEENHISGTTFNLSREELTAGMYILQITQGDKIILNKKIFLED